jgi:flavorubredoxin
VDLRKSEDWWRNLQGALNGRTPDYLVVQHMEPDHAGNIARAMEMYPNMVIVASDRAIKMLPQFFEGVDFEGKTLAVKEGDTLCLGRRTRFRVVQMSG